MVYLTTEPISERRAPVQGEGVSAKYAELTGDTYYPYGTISWDEHVEVWAAYHKQHPNHQDAEMIAQRGGFSYREIILFTGHEPTTWKAN